MAEEIFTKEEYVRLNKYSAYRDNIIEDKYGDGNPSNEDVEIINKLMVEEEKKIMTTAKIRTARESGENDLVTFAVDILKNISLENTRRAQEAKAGRQDVKDVDVVETAIIDVPDKLSAEDYMEE